MDKKNEFQMDVIDHPLVFNWMQETIKRDPESFVLLVGPNSKEFFKLFGQPTWKDNGEKGWKYGWKVSENNLNWIILTGDHGTIFRIQTQVHSQVYLQDPKIGVGLISFLSDLLQKIS